MSSKNINNAWMTAEGTRSREVPQGTLQSLAVAIALTLGAGQAMAQVTPFSQTAAGNYTYQLPANATSVSIEMGGGSGGGGGGDLDAQGGHGAVGSRVIANVAVQGGEAISVTVGGGGAGGVVFRGTDTTPADQPQWGAPTNGGTGPADGGSGGLGGSGGGYRANAYSGAGGGGGGVSLVNINGAAFVRAAGGGGGGGGSWSMGTVVAAVPESAQAALTNVAGCTQGGNGGDGEKTPVPTDAGNGGGGGGGGGGYSGNAGAPGLSGHDQTRTATSGGPGSSCVNGDATHAVSGASSGADTTAGKAGGVGNVVTSDTNIAAGNGTAGTDGWVKITPVLALPAVGVTCTPSQLTSPGQVATCTIASNGPSPDGQPLQVSIAPPASNSGYTSTCTSPVSIAADGTTPTTCTITAGSTLPPALVTATVTVQPGTGYTVDPLKGSADVTVTPAAAPGPGPGPDPTGTTTAVPTLSEWALMLMSALLAGFAAMRLRRNSMR